MGHSALLRVCA